MDALIDYRGKTPEKKDSGIPLITAKIIKAGRIETPTEFIAVDNYDAWMRRGIPHAGDVVLTVEAPLGEVAQLGPEKVALAQRVVTLRGKAGVLDSTFLLYLLQTEEVQGQLKSRATGTTVIGIKQSELRKVPITVPPLDVQFRAAGVLKSLDDRITLLCQTDATLEAIAQNLFKSWFVDFEPVRAKQKGLLPEGMDEATAALFPSEFEESELGLVPRGWRIGKLEDLLLLQRGFDLPAANRIAGDFPIIAASGPSGTHEVPMAKAPGVITGRSGLLGRVFLELEDYWPLNTTLWVKEFRSATPSYAYEVLRRLDFASFNAGSAVPTLNRNHIHSLPYLIPSRACIDAFEALAMLLYRRVRENQKQANSLAEVRDTLLPRLISGQLRLPESEALVA
ncbi:restriction endonuclease subunit S [Paraburkholderia phenoliruptrix]|uniref:restriction endonuclease subunit S n=1 Tax=Paraburkholderia phenoliruptrix TaxID=252970 RepID=UPI0028699528|nr:restriction endonuclease subunit S [Paraburkholderia phenoliruptrix]WMY09098.1 restriction endonuclease subunit S [Paraburkholderia phenoliruptrix]